MQNRASSVQNLKSQAVIKSTPAPKQAPCTREITGQRQASRQLYASFRHAIGGKLARYNGSPQPPSRPPFAPKAHIELCILARPPVVHTTGIKSRSTYNPIAPLAHPYLHIPYAAAKVFPQLRRAGRLCLVQRQEAICEKREVNPCTEIRPLRRQDYDPHAGRSFQSFQGLQGSSAGGYCQPSQDAQRTQV